MQLDVLTRRVGFTLKRRAQILASPHLRLSERLAVALSHHPDAAEPLRRQVREEGDQLALDIDGLRFTVAAPADSADRRSAGSTSARWSPRRSSTR